MIKTRESLTFEIKQLSAELKRMEQQLQMGPAPDAVALNEFRQAVDNVRLTAWSVSELINAERIKKDPDKVLAFLYAERLRRFEQLERNLCSDIERRVLTFNTNGIPGDLQILTPKFYIPTRTTYTLRGCPMREAEPFWRKKARRAPRSCSAEKIA